MEEDSYFYSSERIERRSIFKRRFVATTISYEFVQNALRGSASAFRRRTVLRPAGGDGDKVFPPTYLDGPYATETRVIKGERLPTVLLDSVQSQANRMELALLRAVRSGMIEMPLWQVDFSGTEVSDVGVISSLEAPHRLSDAIFRDSLLDGKAFPGTAQGEAIESSSSQNSTALLETCPTALVFGIWHSTGKRGGMGAKFARAIASEIVGIDYERGRHAAGRIDPLNISKGADVFVSEKDVNHWQLESAGKDFKKKKPSEVNHGNIPPSLPADKEPGNVACECISVKHLRPFRDQQIAAELKRAGEERGNWQNDQEWQRHIQNS